jgi:nitroreductase
MIQNDTLRSILERSSIRAYQPTPLTDEEIETLKAAALAAPTGMNLRELRFKFVTDASVVGQINEVLFDNMDDAQRERLRTRGTDSVFYHAPLVVFITAEPSYWAEVDAGIAVQNLALTAQSMGLSSVILGMPRVAFEGDGSDVSRTLLKMTPRERFIIAIGIGHADTEKQPHEGDPSHILDV